MASQPWVSPLVTRPRPVWNPDPNGPDPSSIYAPPAPRSVFHTYWGGGNNNNPAPQGGAGLWQTLRTGTPPMNTVGGPAGTSIALHGDPNRDIWNAEGAQLDAAGRQIGAAANYYDAQGRALDARGNVLGATGAGLDARGNVLAATGNQLNARGGVLAAMMARRAPAAAVRDAQGNVINAQEQETAATRGFIQRQQAHNADIADQVMKLTAAHNNVADMIAVGKQKNANAAEDRRFNDFGLAAPQDVALPDGSAPVMATGLRGAPQTQEQVMTTKNELANKASDAQLEGARLAVSLLGTNTDAAHQAAARAGLTLDQAQQVVDDAQLAEQEATLGTSRASLNEDYANLGTSRANLGEDYANLDVSRAGNTRSMVGLGGDVADLQLRGARRSPFPGGSIYTTPNGQGAWVTPQEQAQQRYQNGDELAGYSISYIRSLVAQGLASREVATAALRQRGLPDVEIARQLADAANNRGGGGYTEIPPA